MANALLATGREDAYAQLTDRQRLFVEFYLGKANANASLAAKLAGYSSIASGADNLNNPQIYKAIEERYASHRFSADECIARMIEIARGGHAAFITAGEGGDLYVDTQGLIDAGLGRLVKKITNGKHGQTIEFLDTQRALETIGKSMGVLRETIDVVVHAADPEQLRAGIDAEIRALEAQLTGQRVETEQALEAEFTVEAE